MGNAVLRCLGCAAGLWLASGVGLRLAIKIMIKSRIKTLSGFGWGEIGAQFVRSSFVSIGVHSRSIAFIRGSIAGCSTGRFETSPTLRTGLSSQTFRVGEAVENTTVLLVDSGFRLVSAGCVYPNQVSSYADGASERIHST